MSLERMKELMRRLNESSYLTTDQGISDLDARSPKNRQQLMQLGGDGVQATQKTQAAHNEFLRAAGVKHLDGSDGSHGGVNDTGFDGDDTFKSMVQNITNAGVVADIFSAMNDVLNRQFRTDRTMRFYDVKIRNKRSIYLFLRTTKNDASNPEFQTSKGKEFGIKMSFVGNNEYKVDEIHMLWLQRVNPAQDVLNKFYDGLKRHPQYNNSAQNEDEQNHIIFL